MSYQGQLLPLVSKARRSSCSKHRWLTLSPTAAFQLDHKIHLSPLTCLLLNRLPWSLCARCHPHLQSYAHIKSLDLQQDPSLYTPTPTSLVSTASLAWLTTF